jgi:glycosyltransferase involved in cell wall biosynthesis
VLEAMACGAPVVATSVTSVPEIAGGAALLVPPRSPAAMAEALGRAVREADALRRRGLERAASFTWERTASELDDALAGLL